jgi:hypothetical protein
MNNNPDLVAMVFWGGVGEWVAVQSRPISLLRVKQQGQGSDVNFSFTPTRHFLGQMDL